MLQNEPLVAIIVVDTAENEPLTKFGGKFNSLFIRLLNQRTSTKPAARAAALQPPDPSRMTREIKMSPQKVGALRTALLAGKSPQRATQRMRQ